MKVYVTLNEEKEKDRVIIEYLNCQYSKSGAIKSILYQLATNGGNLPLVAATPIEGNKHQEAPKESKNDLVANAPKEGKKLNLAEFL